MGSASTSISRASARPRSLTSSHLFTPIFVPEAVQDEADDNAWLRALLDVEVALAAAGAAEGVIPPEAGKAIAQAPLKLVDLGIAARAAGTPVVPLVQRLRAEVSEWAHHGATSQDILDSAA